MINSIKLISLIKKTVFLLCMVLVCFGIASPCFGEQKLLAMPVTEPPVIDGLAGDPAWENAQEIITLDKSSKLPITIKAVYTDTEFFVQVSFPDKDESRTHKSWIWNKGREIYTVGHDREDIIIFKWNMDSDPVDLSIVADNPHHADIWYWKACRTDATGYADDKSHLLSQTEEQDSTKIISKSGKTMYLFRKSDVKAKGVWENGTWTIEFRRNFITGHQDDVQFTTARKYLFGVSRYEIAGRNANKALSARLYGTGDANKPLWLEFNK